MIVEFAVVLALLAALTFGLQAVFVELGMDAARREFDVSPAFTGALVTILVSLPVFWLFAIYRGIPVSALSVETVAPFVAAGVLYPAIFRFLYFESIERIGASVSAAIVGTYPVYSTLLAVAFLDEELTVYAIAGLVLIVGGGGLLQLTYRSAKDDEGGAETDALVRKLANVSPWVLGIPLLAAVVDGIGQVLIKVGLNGLGEPALGTALVQTTALIVFGGVMVGSSRMQSQMSIFRSRSILLPFFVAGLFVAAAWLFQLFALNAGTVVTVVPIVNSYLLVVALGSYAVARELPKSPRVIGAILAILAGVTLVQL